MKFNCKIILVLTALLASCNAQYLGEEELNPLQQTAYIDGKTRDLDKIGHMIYTNRTTTTLNCASGFMNIVVDFNEPFFGIIYPNGSRTSACLTHGTGDSEYTINLPLKGCGTKRVDRRVFVNNIIVRFHKGLELEGDEVKTIICRYPSPEVILPPGPPVPIIAPIPPAPKRIGEVEILMIICAIVFLALLLVGMACSYTCLKKRNIRIVRRRPLSAAPSEISKISGSTLLFDGLKIPRAHATSTSDSDTALVSQSETLPSDYPSESPSSGSEVEEGDVHSIQVHEDLSSVYSDAHAQSEAEMFAPQLMLRPPKPTFMVRVKKAPTPPRTPEPDYSIQNALSQSLTTILERDESFRGESLPGSEHALILTESEDDMNPPPTLLPPPGFSEVHRQTQEMLIYKPPPKIDVHHTENITHLKQEITDIEEIVEHGKRRFLAPRPPSEPDSDYPSEARSVTDIVEDLVVVPRPPTITTHMVDDRYNTTVKETHVTEDIEKHRRFVKQYHMKPKPLPPPKWNVAIRHYQAPKYADDCESSGPEWEAYSEPGSDIFRAQMLEGIDDRLSQIDVETMEHPPPPNWTVLLRVLDPPPTEEATREFLSIEDREKWRQIITTESTLRTMLTTATVREDYEMIRRDQRYEKLFEPTKWDVIIRILSPPHGRSHPGDETSSEAPSASDTESLSSFKDGKRYRKFEPPAAAGGRRSSLPPLYEYDSEGNPIVKKIPGPQSSRSRRSSKSSLASGDVRSIAETEVNFARVHGDTWSEASGPSSSGGARSHADRSHSEITFSVPVLHDEDYPDTDVDDRLSARTARSLARSASEFTEDWRHHDRMERYSESSADSKPNRQRERSTSEYMEEAPHLSDFPTSPDHSPSASPQMGDRRYAHHYSYEMKPYEADEAGAYMQEGHFQHSTFVDERGDGRERVFQREVHTTQTHASSSGYRQTKFPSDDKRK